jgi:predicted DCC family thiol-disulfide oxidoreductase YuxK
MDSAFSPLDVTADGHPLIVFDGLCVLCSANARFVLRHDRKRRFRLTTAQGPIGSALYRRFGLATDDYETMIVIDEQGRLLTDSDGAIAIFSRLGWPWRAAAVARIVPKRLRDTLYRLVARNRYRLFGRREACWLPLPAEADRIL